MAESPNLQSPLAPIALGSGTGTALLLLAETLDNPSVKAVCVFAAPSVSVVAAALWSWAQNWAARWIENKGLDRQAKEALTAVAAAMNATEDPNERRYLQKQHTTIYRYLVKRKIAGLRELEPG